MILGFKNIYIYMVVANILHFGEVCHSILPKINNSNLLSSRRNSIVSSNPLTSERKILPSVSSYKILSRRDIEKYDIDSVIKFKNLSYDQQISVLTYTYRSGSINETVSGRKDIKTIWHQDIQYFIDNLDKVLSQNVLSENLVVYRGANRKYLGKLEKGSVITTHNYWSTSLNKKVAQDFLDQDRNKENGIMLKILVSKGTNSYYVGENTGWEYQSELILPKGLQFRVLSVQNGSAILETVN